jgi:hypothetical protein
MTHRTYHTRCRKLRSAKVPAEALEQRRMLCLTPAGGAAGEIDLLGGSAHVKSLHDPDRPVVEKLPGFVPTKDVPYLSGSTRNPSPADIVWVNRGVTTGTNSDRFADIFGAQAETARRVVDQAIIDFERMIGSFNYATPSNFELTLSMLDAGTGFGAAAGMTGSLGGKPQEGIVFMGAGNTSTTDPFKGWFVDTTPADDTEFQGNFQHAFTAGAHTGSPAVGKGDFYTVVAAELTHALGLSSQLPGWTNLTTDTGVLDNSEGGGVGRFYIFDGPSINHLMTSNNGGPSGDDFNEAVHSAGPSVRVIGGVTYVAQNDIGNARYEFGVRYKPNYAFALMFRDAYGFATQNPAQFGSFYAQVNPVSRLLRVYGGDLNNFTTADSPDRIDIRVDGSDLIVSVDVGLDVGGTGALPGPGDLPAWEHRIALSRVSSIEIAPGMGDDTITIDASVTLPIEVAGWLGNDTLILESGLSGRAWSVRGISGTGAIRVFDVESISVVGGAGNDSLTLASGLTTPVNFDGNGGSDMARVLGNTAADTITLNGNIVTGTTNLTHSDVEVIVLDGLGAADTFRVTGDFGSSSLTRIELQITPGDIVNLATNGVAPTILIGGSYPIVNVETPAAGGNYALTVGSISGSVSVTGFYDAINFLGGAGNDLITLPTDFGPPVSFTGGSGADTLHMTGYDTINEFRLNGTTLRSSLQNAGAVVSHNGVEQFILDGQGLPDNFLLSGPVTAVVRTGSGDDSVVLNTGARAIFDQPEDSISTLSVQAGSLAEVAASGANTLRTTFLELLGTLNLNDNPLILRQPATPPLRTLLTNGYNAGWNTAPQAIVSGTVAASPIGDTLGYATASQLNVTSFGGLTVGAFDTLIRRTLGGDANFDGTVNFADLLILAQSYGSTSRDFRRGDFDFSPDGAVNFSDLLILAQNYGASLASVQLLSDNGQRPGNPRRRSKAAAVLA